MHMHLLSMEIDSSLPPLPCMCASVRRSSRALTQLYEEALSPWGLRSTQFTILQFLSVAGEIGQGKLGEYLALDSTTLTRTLAILIRNGWIQERRGDDRRERFLKLTKSGERKFAQAVPSWEKVQAKLQRALGTDDWQKLLASMNQLTRALTEM